MVIEYKAGNYVAENEDILIMGEFNEWFPEPMTLLEERKYKYEVSVLPGFKYRFQFIVNGEIVIDPC